MTVRMMDGGQHRAHTSSRGRTYTTWSWVNVCCVSLGGAVEAWERSFVRTFSWFWIIATRVLKFVLVRADAVLLHVFALSPAVLSAVVLSFLPQILGEEVRASG